MTSFLEDFCKEIYALLTITTLMQRNLDKIIVIPIRRINHQWEIFFSY